MTFERGLAEVRHAYAGHPRATAPRAPVHRGFRRPAHAKTTPARWRVGCVGCTRERNWVSQTRGRPSQAEARESSRRFRLEAVPWKPPRSPSSLPPRSTVVPSTSSYTQLGPIPSPVCLSESERDERGSTPSRWYEGIGEWLYLDRNGLVATPLFPCHRPSVSRWSKGFLEIFENEFLEKGVERENWKCNFDKLEVFLRNPFDSLGLDLFFVAFTHSSFSLHSCWWHWGTFGHMDRFGSIRFHISFCI